ncbi:medium-chain fatty acid ethyl ester synthase/esterase 2 [Quercus suber]|uniref:Medium-chain fatty acid ethyl ester synthase/esterase 2 n=1 Tax=Quercus suber TaxID=58331 RepID=A0AAW0KP01_QUESU
MFFSSTRAATTSPKRRRETTPILSPIRFPSPKAFIAITWSFRCLGCFVWCGHGRKPCRFYFKVVVFMLFTAADSDDISTAIQFINKARPWIILMAIGWEYGANMLTKYLVEARENTPLTAATCIHNPFDLKEATRSFPYHMAIGKAKGFNVEKALLAKSVHDLEKTVSMSLCFAFSAPSPLSPLLMMLMVFTYMTARAL